MKDLLIVLAPDSQAQREICNTIETEALKIDKSVRRVLETAFLLSGPRSFEIAILLHRIASDKGLPVAVFEIEQLLFSQPKAIK